MKNYSSVSNLGASKKLSLPSPVTILRVKLNGMSVPKLISASSENLSALSISLILSNENKDFACSWIFSPWRYLILASPNSPSADAIK